MLTMIFFYIDYNNLCHSYKRQVYLYDIWQEIDKIIDVLLNWDNCVYMVNRMRIPFKFDKILDKIVNRGEIYDE